MLMVYQSLKPLDSMSNSRPVLLHRDDGYVELSDADVLVNQGLDAHFVT